MMFLCEKCCAGSFVWPNAMKSEGESEQSMLGPRRFPFFIDGVLCARVCEGSPRFILSLHFLSKFRCSDAVVRRSYRELRPVSFALSESM